MLEPLRLPNRRAGSSSKLDTGDFGGSGIRSATSHAFSHIFICRSMAWMLSFNAGPNAIGNYNLAPKMSTPPKTEQVFSTSTINAAEPSRL